MPLPTLKLLGSFALDLPAPGRMPSLGRKGEALLAFVALQGPGGASRSQLISRLWPDLAEDDARTALRQCLHQVRRCDEALAAALLTEGDRIVLKEGACEVDVHRFESLARCDDVASLLAAAGLYRGDLGEGIGAGAEFECWLAAERERLRDLAQALLARLSERAEGGPALESASILARRLLATDPVHEGVWCALVRVHARAGLQAKTVQVWRECRRALWRELQVEPSAHTAATVRSLLGSETGPPSRPAVAGAAAIPAGAFDARGHEAALDDMLRGWQCFTLFTPEGNRLARGAFESAHARSAGHAEAIALLGFTHLFDAIHGWTADVAASLGAAAQCAEAALACNRADPRPLQLQAKLLLWHHQHDSASELLRHAVTLAPGSAYAHFHLGEAEMWCGRGDEALAHVDRALRLDANDHGVFLTIRANTLWLMGEPDAARADAARAITRNPAYSWPHATLAAVLAEQGELDAARRAAATARRLNRRLSASFAATVMPYRQPEHRERARRAFALAGMPDNESSPLP